MMKKGTAGHIAGFLNRLLRVRKIKDASVNGLQKALRAGAAVKTVGFAVDACITTFEKARRRHVDMLVVHHGVIWKRQKDTVLAKERIAYLKKNNMALYAAHLPLDVHEEFGNNVQLAKALDVQGLYKFGMYHGVKVGYAGALRKTVRLESIAGRLNAHLKAECRVYRFGNKQVRSIGIVSGGGGDLLLDAVREGLDCFLVGEIDLAVYNAARDHQINVITAGHYVTETVGLKSLMPLIRGKYDVRTIFIDDPKKL